jgi:hypothetical protein
MNRLIIRKLSLRIEPPHNGKHVVPITVIRPCLEACVVDLGIQCRCNVKQSNVFDINMDYYSYCQL